MSSLLLKRVCLLITIVAAVICSAAVRSDVEQARCSRASEEIPTVAERYASRAYSLSESLAAASEADRERIVADSALGLWRQSVADVQHGPGDDRPLYWGRLALRDAISQNSDAQSKDRLLALAEQHSRGMTDVGFPDGPGYRVLITGFDPFHLDQSIAQSNPSGLAALSLDGLTLNLGDRSAHLQSALIPVRFEDFDSGLIEDFLAQHYDNVGLSMVVTISMGREAFDLERFPGRRRSAESPDNRNVLTGATAKNPLIPMLQGKPLDGPEFVEFSLPAAEMLTAEGDWAIRDNGNVETLERGELEASSLAELADQTAVRGSGGGYLSNEISYRSILLRNKLGHTFPIGHIHTPSVRGYDEDAERRIVEQIRRMLQLAVAALQ